ncbi:MAG: phage holin, LLH family [Clostridium sp.]|jgi:hypothetical protein|uniref:phage holin, LLH family n=1 Tax=Clostridium sp. TaxID=1506 RepID=UPI0025BF5FEC|nr:phage holin, LLH family [Clostridium sp.]MCH3962823.1 phage holin, LLH family [Clostridium sp.]MCI1715762.1 phage holin, LLH family [Clostridium sp.]MCI1800033.1 phage holin, LLH family [Clostridium sp.]MCI1813947.1 phage holin, LLH family [Clostridium sp.]MCI1870845.1 phage holin, LLH family [Clostridium sp.]
MFNINDIIAVGGILVGVIGGVFGIVSLLKRDSKFQKKVSSSKPTAALIDWIEQKSVSGVKAAEQLSHSGRLKTNQEKFTAAQNTVYAALEEIGVVPTDNQKKLIDDFIQGAVNDLGHGPEDEVQKNQQLQSIQQKLAVLQSENAQLKQTLISIKGTAGTIE